MADATPSQAETQLMVDAEGDVDMVEPTKKRGNENLNFILEADGVWG